MVAGRPRALLSRPERRPDARVDRAGIDLARTYDISPDGQRFLMLKNADAPTQSSNVPRIVIVQNWLEELKRLVPPE